MAVKDFYNVDLGQFGGKVKLGKKSTALALGALLYRVLRRKKTGKEISMTWDSKAREGQGGWRNLAKKVYK